MEPDVCVPVKRWMWTGFIVEIAKPIVGLTYGLATTANATYSAVLGIHGDLVAHHNFLREQEFFHDVVTNELEQLPEA